MTDTLTETIYRTAGLFDVAWPRPVLDAAAILDAAQALRAGIAAEQAPDLGTLTVKNLPGLHAAAVDWENRDARLRAAETIVKAAEDQLNTAKFVHARKLWEPLADLFNDRGETFTATLTEMNGHTTLTPGNGELFARLQTAATELDQLRQARDAYAPRGSQATTGFDRFEQMSRVLHITGPGTPDDVNFNTTPAGIAFWADALGRGFVIRWQDKESQEANWRQCRAANSTARNTTHSPPVSSAIRW